MQHISSHHVLRLVGWCHHVPGNAHARAIARESSSVMLSLLRERNALCRELGYDVDHEATISERTALTTVHHHRRTG